MRSMAYSLLPDNIEKSGNPSLEDIKKTHFIYSNDTLSAEDGLDQAYTDHIRGRGIGIGKYPCCSKMAIAREEFDQRLVETFPHSDEREKIRSHYSQSPIRFASLLILAISKPLCEEKLLVNPPAESDIQTTLYQEGQDVYIKSTIKKFPILDSDNTMAKVGELAGPVEVLFTLTDKGFELQRINTDSTLIKNMVMGALPEVPNPSQYFLDQAKMESAPMREIDSYQEALIVYRDTIQYDLQHSKGGAQADVHSKDGFVRLLLKDLQNESATLADRKQEFLAQIASVDFKNWIRSSNDGRPQTMWEKAFGKAKVDERGEKLLADIDKIEKIFSVKKSALLQNGLFRVSATASPGIPKKEVALRRNQ